MRSLIVSVPHPPSQPSPSRGEGAQENSCHLSIPSPSKGEGAGGGERLRLILIFLFTVHCSLFTSSCGAIRRVATRQVVRELEGLSRVVEQQTDLELLRDAAPTSLLLVEALIERNPENRELLVLGCRSYLGYAQAFVERENPTRASRMYLKARDFGRRALRANRRFAKALDEGEDFDLAVRNLDADDVGAMFWTLSAWGAYANLHMNDVDALFDVPDLRALTFRVFEVAPDYFYSSPRLFVAVLYATLPSIAGGGAEMARVQFEKAIEATQGRFLVARVLRAQHYATLVHDPSLFDSDLRTVLEAPDDLLPEAALINQVAKRMAQDLMARKEELF